VKRKHDCLKRGVYKEHKSTNATNVLLRKSKNALKKGGWEGIHDITLANTNPRVFECTQVFQFIAFREKTRKIHEIILSKLP